jgi:SAM domain (Sterile alpha motif)
MDLGAWLKQAGFERYEAAFRDNGIDEAVLPHLTAEDLKEIGVATVGDRRKLLAAIAALASPTASGRKECPKSSPSAALSPSCSAISSVQRRSLRGSTRRIGAAWSTLISTRPRRQ